VNARLFDSFADVDVLDTPPTVDDVLGRNLPRGHGPRRHRTSTATAVMMRRSESWCGSSMTTRSKSAVPRVVDRLRIAVGLWLVRRYDRLERRKRGTRRSPPTR
jgi:hypothetical protein